MKCNLFDELMEKLRGILENRQIAQTLSKAGNDSKIGLKVKALLSESQFELRFS